MKHKLIFFVFLPLLISINGYCSYIKGKVVDENNEPLPFATVYIHNTTYGVTTNTLGDYFIELKPGNYDITYSFIGYQSVKWNEMMAASIVGVFPVLIVFVFLQKYIVEGLTAGAVKN